MGFFKYKGKWSIYSWGANALFCVIFEVHELVDDFSGVFKGAYKWGVKG